MTLDEFKKRITGLTITGVEAVEYRDDEKLQTWAGPENVMLDCDLTLDDGSLIHGPPLMWCPRE